MDSFPPPRSGIGADMSGTSGLGIGYGKPKFRPVCPECHPYSHLHMIYSSFFFFSVFAVDYPRFGHVDATG
ncbi:hypothetical protein RHMOL_Rhmol09G0092800 [Rhododendron molle]|uniref:Uncharacterized protein n=1 Tax=Rhododendron molle TaxID=49168 RepID=A0ACC0MCL2_RHOML|nr:hypothetical protein RHMOL_Rhmol09G0092800 [Rhododendron molle]